MTVFSHIEFTALICRNLSLSVPQSGQSHFTLSASSYLISSLSPQAGSSLNSPGGPFYYYLQPGGRLSSLLVCYCYTKSTARWQHTRYVLKSLRPKLNGSFYPTTFWNSLSIFLNTNDCIQIFHGNVLLMYQFILSQHWFRWWLVPQ